MQPLCDVLVELVVADVLRELGKENAVGLGGQHDGVEDEECKAYTPITHATGTSTS